MAQDPDGEVLFFIPDITGFTRFVADTEIRHSEHIIRELLEALVDANSIGLEVCEFEGDAVLFVRTGKPPALADCVEQARRMYVQFHTLLQRSELARVCQCGACRGASGLTVKFVAHRGTASEMRVKSSRKYIGPAVIVAHRLLKNSVAEREYLLLSQPLIDALTPAGQGGVALTPGSDSYDAIGPVAYGYLPLASYLDQVKVEPPEVFQVPNPKLVLSLKRALAARIEDVYQTMIDLPGRLRWIDGVKEVRAPSGDVNTIGTVHRCVRSGSDPDLVTSNVKITDSTMEFWETDTKRMGCCRYLLERKSDDSSELSVEFFVRGNPVVQLMFRLTMQRKLQQGFERSLQNLAALVERPGAA